MVWIKAGGSYIRNRVPIPLGMKTKLPWESEVTQDSTGSSNLLITLNGATTRFYLHNSLAAPAITPAFSATWTDNNEAVRRSMTRTHSLDALAEGTTIDWTAGAVALDRQYISEPIKGGTIAGTAKCQIRSREIAGGDNAQQRLGLRVVSNDGLTVRGTLLAVAFYGVLTELAAGGGLTNRFYANGDALSSVVAVDGDRLVLELGYTDVAGATPEAVSQWGSISASGDLPEDETDQLAKRPWFEITVT